MNYEITKREHPHFTFETYRKHFLGLEALRTRFQREDRESRYFSGFRWQKSSRDHIIRSVRDYNMHLEYLYYNAVKHGLVANPEDWSWMWVEGMPEPRFVR